MKLITPPKLMPPYQSAAASGTFPTEQTKLIIAMKGPTITFSSDVQNPCPLTNTVVPDADGDEDGEEAGDQVAGRDLLPHHLHVGERVARRVGPARLRRQPLAPRPPLNRIVRVTAVAEPLARRLGLPRASARAGQGA